MLPVYFTFKTLDNRVHVYKCALHTAHSESKMLQKKKNAFLCSLQL